LRTSDAGMIGFTIRAFKKSGVTNEVVVVRDGAEALDYLFATGKYQGRDASVLPAS
jgi:two-component system response regulator